MRFENIDAVRGVAALLVMFQHIFTNPLVLASSQTIAFASLAICSRWIDIGKLGVLMFFAVSGYVIPFSFKGARPIERFVVSRFFRLYPAYWLSIALAVPLLLAVGKPVGTGEWLANLTMVQRLFGQPDVLGVYWTLFVELVFYALCAAACAAGLLKRPRFVLSSLLGWTALLVVLALLIFITGRKLPIAPVFGLSVMYLGSLIRLSQIERDLVAERVLPIALAVVMAGHVAACYLAFVKNTNPEVSSWHAQALATVAALGGFLAASRYHGPVSRALTFLGAISYALYLIHQLVVMVVSPLFRGSGWAGAICFSTLATGLALIISWLVFRWVEEPFIAKGHTVARALETRR